MMSGKTVIKLQILGSNGQKYPEATTICILADQFVINGNPIETTKENEIYRTFKPGGPSIQIVGGAISEQ